MAVADAPSANAPADASEPSISNPVDGSHTSVEGSFAQGMYVSIWPKIERCHNYVSVLLAAQEHLQETVDELIAGLKEAEKADASSLVNYADRLKHFPGRVERLQHKLEIIEDRLIVLKESRGRGASLAVKTVQADKSQPQNSSPLF